MISNLVIIGCGMVAFSIGALIIELSEYTKTRDVATGIITFKNKKTGEKFIQHMGGTLIKIN